MKYRRPTPPVGMHRYVFLLFKQAKEMGTAAARAAPAERNNFSVRDWVKQQHLDPAPVGVAFFYVSKDAQEQHEVEETINLLHKR